MAETEASDEELAALKALIGEADATTTGNLAAVNKLEVPGDAPKVRYLVPGIESFLGHGYDVFGEFASPNSVKARIYDLSKEPQVDQPTVDQSISLDAEQLSHAFTVPPTELRLVYSRPQRVGYTNVFQSSTEIKEITTSDKTKVKWGVGGTIEGGYGGFTGEIEGRFDTKTTRLATAHCLQATFQTIYWKLDVNDYSLTNPPPISKDVTNDFATQPVDSLMEKYGTHCLEEVGIGTKIVHSYTIDTSKFSRKMDVTAALKAKYDGGSFNAGVNVDSEYHDAAWNDRSAVSVKIFTYGTSDHQLAEITDLSQGLGEHPLAVLRQGWHNPTLIQFYKSSLRPLWKVQNLMEPAKAVEFERRFKERAVEEQVQLGHIFEGLQPIYLLGTTDGGRRKYRLEQTPHYKYGGEEWTVENDGKPWQYLSATDKPGMVPLYELGLNDDNKTVRYETQSWCDIFGRHPIEGYAWSKTGRTLGYVYDSTGPDTRVPEDAVPVYAFYDKGGQAGRGVFYSYLKELVWDQGAWKPLGEIGVMQAEFARAARAAFERDWDAHDGWYKFWNAKPDFHPAEHGFILDADGVMLMSPGIPHWYSLKAA